MKAFKLFLLAICLAIPFGDAFAGSRDIDIVVLTPNKPVKKLGTTIETSVCKIGERAYSVTFGKSYEDVAVEIYSDSGELIGTLYADFVNVGDTVIVNATEDGAVELTVYSGDDEVFSTIL